MSVIHNTDLYSYILNTYSKDKPSNRFDSHKRSELRSVYNRMVKSNKETPLYKIKDEGIDATKFALDLKENARATENLISSLSIDGSDMEDVFHKKIATSSDESSVHVDYVGQQGDEPSATSFDLSVKSLATPQINTGHYLFSLGRDIEPGSYAFDLDTSTNSYEFQFNVNTGDNNLDVQGRIARLINTTDIPLSATILYGENDTSALSIFSKQTGLGEDVDYLFNISSPTSWQELDMLGIGSITSPATNSVFTINGDEHTSMSNTFTINKDFEITLKAPTNGNTHIGFKSNTDAIADSVQDLADTYNDFLNTAEKYKSLGGGDQLKREMLGIIRAHSGELDSVGISSGEEGQLSVDRQKLAEAVTGDAAKSSFDVLNRFKDTLLRQAQKTATNPMNYIDKVTVAYKNPGKTFAAPYADSRFSGMLVDQRL